MAVDRLDLFFGGVVLSMIGRLGGETELGLPAAGVVCVDVCSDVESDCEVESCRGVS